MEAQTGYVTCRCSPIKAVEEPRLSPAFRVPEAVLAPGQLGGRWEVGWGGVGAGS